MIINKVFNTINIFLLFSLLSGCGKNPLAPGGILGTKVEIHTSTTSSSPILYKGGSLNELTVEIYVVISKLEISITGEVWQEIYTGNKEVKVTNKDATVISDITKSVASGEYHGVRIWFGDKIKAKEYISGSLLYEGEKNNFSVNNPFVFSTLNGKLEYPIIIERGSETFIIFQFPYELAQYAIITDEYWTPYYFGEALKKMSVRTTKFKF